MDSPAYSIRLKTESNGKAGDAQTQRRRKIVIISVMCCVVVLLLGGLAGGVWYYNRNVESMSSKADRTSVNFSSVNFSSVNFSSVGGFQSVSAGSKRTVSGLGQTGASGQSRGQTSAAGPASENEGGSMKAVQVEDGSFLGRARLFYANNRRAVLIAVVVSVVVVIAIVATVTAVMLLQQQQQAVVGEGESHGSNFDNSNTTSSVNIRYIIAGSVVACILSLISVIHMIFYTDFQPKSTLQAIVHFIIHTVFLSLPSFFYHVARFVKWCCKSIGMPGGIRYPLQVIAIVPFLALSFFPVLSCILMSYICPIGPISTKFKDFMKNCRSTSSTTFHEIIDAVW